MLKEGSKNLQQDSIKVLYQDTRLTETKRIRVSKNTKRKKTNLKGGREDRLKDLLGYQIRTTSKREHEGNATANLQGERELHEYKIPESDAYCREARSRDSTALVRHERGFHRGNSRTRVDVPPPPKVRAGDQYVHTGAAHMVGR